MRRLWVWFALIVFSVGSGFAAPPSYSAGTIVNACDGSHGPFAPNTIVTIYGSSLAWSTRALTPEDLVDRTLPTVLNGVRVFVNGWAAPLFLVSEKQVNFLMPANQIAGRVTLFLLRESVAGPEVSLTLHDAAPALFPSLNAPGYAVAQNWPDYALIEPDAPVHPGEFVILYASGLGRTQPYPKADEIPTYVAFLEGMDDFQVYLDGKLLDPARVYYAGLAPGWAGLYQVNLLLPEDTGPDPEIRLAAANQMSAPGLRIAVRPDWSPAGFRPRGDLRNSPRGLTTEAR